jgi:hypothetical protein
MIERLEQAIARAQTALSSSPEPPPEAQALGELAFRVKKLKRAWGRPQSLGFFGPSQAGKSFLVGALLSHELGTLLVKSRTREIDFLKEINPAKGVESTGVVTRFSTAPSAALVKGDFRCQLASLEVVLQSLATGFLVECTAPAVNPDRVERVLREARMQAGPPAPAVYREAWETVWRNLSKRYRDRHAYLNELRRHPELRGESWKAGIGSIGGWLRMYSLLWGGHGYAPDLDALAERLVQGLEIVGHAGEIEVELAHVRAAADHPSLIDAACLNSIGTSKAPIQVFDPAASRNVSIDPSVLAALIAEIRLPFAPVPGSLFDKADLLDFPGGRALRGINGFEATDLATKNLENAIEVYKRGKLTFLFEQYALDREITALVLTSPGPTKPEAIQMQHQVERWLQIRHGAPAPSDKDELEQPSLFLALTKFDMSLGALRSDNARDRWDSRVEEACVEFWARSHASWIYNWGGPDRPFTNMFWIRNPYADQMHTLKVGTSDYDEVKRGYHESLAVRTYVAEHASKWTAVEGNDDATGLPRSGVPLLASHLRTKLAEDIKARELGAEARAIHSELLSVLRALTPSRDEAEARERLQDAAKQLVASLQKEMTRSYSGAVFGEFVERITIGADELEMEVRDHWREVAPMSVKASDKVKKLMVHVLKHWMRRSIERFQTSELDLPHSHVERFVREVCTSKKLLPILGQAIFPYFARSDIDYAIVAEIMRVKISDALLGLFSNGARSTPSIPVRLSYSEVIGPPGTEEASIDWADVSFDDEPSAPKVEHVDIVFAGKRLFGHWSDALPGFYLDNAGSASGGKLDDPRVKELIAVLRDVESQPGA